MAKNAWSTLVQEKFRLGRILNPKYSLSQAMKSAKKVYKKTTPLIKSFTMKKKGTRAKGKRKRNKKSVRNRK
jgi:hypothetical protein